MLTSYELRCIRSILEFCADYRWIQTGTLIHVDAEATEYYTPESPLMFAYNQTFEGILPAIHESASWLEPARMLGLSYTAGFVLRLCAYWDGASTAGTNAIYTRADLGAQLFNRELRDELCNLLI